MAYSFHNFCKNHARRIKLWLGGSYRHLAMKNCFFCKLQGMGECILQHRNQLRQKSYGTGLATSFLPILLP